MEPLLFILVFLISLIAALIDVMVGGGGLITIPALGALNFPLRQVIATNRLYVLFFTLVGFAHYWHKKIRTDFKPIVLLLIARSLGAFLGANAVLSVPASSLKLVVAGFVLAALVAILALEKNAKMLANMLPKGNAKLALAAILFLILGYYEGFVGGGGGTIARILLMLFLGLPLLEASLAELLMSVATAITASAVFLAHQQVDFTLFVPMLVGGIIGALAGSHIAVHKGEKWLRPLLFGIVVLLLIKLVFF